jgi:hypothetical protein
MNSPGHITVPQTPSESGTLLGEAFSGGPSKGNYESMARRRFQDPKPRVEGNWWVLYYWQDDFTNGERGRRRKREKLAPATMREREVLKIASEFLRPINQGLVNIGSATVFKDFVDGTYIPVVIPQMAPCLRWIATSPAWDKRRNWNMNR